MKYFYLLSFLCIYFLSASCENRPAACDCSKGQCDTLVIISTNDVHAHIENMAGLSAYVQSQRDSFSHVLLLSAGDIFSGGPAVDQYKERGYPMIDLMNTIGYAAHTLGNHGLDYGRESLKLLIDKAGFPFLCANADFTATSLKDAVKPYIIKDVNGIRVVILGLIETSDAGHPSSLPENMEGIRFSDGVAVAGNYVSLRDSGQVFVVLSHLGVTEDVKLALQLPEADVVVGGHSHTVLPAGIDTNGVLITQTGCYLQYIGKTTLLLKDGKVVSKKNILVPVETLTMIDSAVQRKVDSYANNPALKKTVGRAAADIAGKEELGNLITDALRTVHRFDIAVTNSGGMRTTILPKGPVTFEQVYTLDPFENQLYVYRLSLEEMKALLKLVYNEKPSDLLRISGAQYTLLLDPADTARALDVAITDYKGAPLRVQPAYTVVMNDYIKERFMPFVDHKDEGRLIKATTAETLLQYLKQGPVYPQPQRVFTVVSD